MKKKYFCFKILKNQNFLNFKGFKILKINLIKKPIGYVLVKDEKKLLVFWEQFFAKDQ